MHSLLSRTFLPTNEFEFYKALIRIHPDSTVMSWGFHQRFHWNPPKNPLETTRIPRFSGPLEVLVDFLLVFSWFSSGFQWKLHNFQELVPYRFSVGFLSVFERSENQ